MALTAAASVIGCDEESEYRCRAVDEDEFVVERGTALQMHHELTHFTVGLSARQDCARTGPVVTSHVRGASRPLVAERAPHAGYCFETGCNRLGARVVLSGMSPRIPGRKAERRGLHLWNVGTVLLLVFTGAVAVASFVFYTGWDLLGARELKKQQHIDSKTLFDLVKLSFGVVAGAGALVALVVAYRRQRVDEDAALRDATRLHNERFTNAVSQLGHESPTVRLGGVHSLAGLADDAPTRQVRQTCIDVLCAFLRLPYTGESDLPTGDAEARHSSLALREARHTVIRLIRDHLRLPPEHPLSWQGYDFDFTNAVFDGGDLSRATFSGGEVSFWGATFCGEEVDFSRATFSGAEVSFSRATFSGGEVSFDDATFSGGKVYFLEAAFTGGTVHFSGATFLGGSVNFSGSTFSGGRVNFTGTTLSGGTVDFISAVFSSGWVNFSFATFSGAEVSFAAATFSSGSVDFGDVTFSGGSVIFIHATGSAPVGLQAAAGTPAPAGVTLAAGW
ncbi:pentapeptide repeat-containing protein [Streptomyces sp. NBC_00887]|uniref:pentapeptide repeat-containing protein n=1 Tax=Streptomyces sp. NBC_00887 TaxID=2975859 RepID=UPI0038664092|nr:pentapeptide repeat-containing protein [Streptomyces sp. NBC_00887]